MQHLLFDPRTSNYLDFWPFVVKHLGPSDLKKLKEHIYVAHIKKHVILKCKNIIKYIYICIIKTKGRNLKIKTPDINSLVLWDSFPEAIESQSNCQAGEDACCETKKKTDD